MLQGFGSAPIVPEAAASLCACRIPSTASRDRRRHLCICSSFLSASRLFNWPQLRNVLRMGGRRQALPERPLEPPARLTGGCIRQGQVFVGRTPDSADATAGTDEQRRRSKTNEREQ